MKEDLEQQNIMFESGRKLGESVQMLEQVKTLCSKLIMKSKRDPLAMISELELELAHSILELCRDPMFLLDLSKDA